MVVGRPAARAGRAPCPIPASRAPSQRDDASAANSRPETGNTNSDVNDDETQKDSKRRSSNSSSHRNGTNVVDDDDDADGSGRAAIGNRSVSHRRFVAADEFGNCVAAAAASAFDERFFALTSSDVVVGQDNRQLGESDKLRQHGHCNDASSLMLLPRLAVIHSAGCAATD